MIQLLRVLQKLKVCWKKIGHYNMKCRWPHGFYQPEPMANNHVHDDHYIGHESATVANDFRPQSIVKFEMQVS